MNRALGTAKVRGSATTQIRGVQDAVPDALIQSARRLRIDVGRLAFGLPVTHVYNPLEYAWEPHEAYLRTYGGTRKQVVFIGMNPGPFGMVQTGVPFGEIAAVRDWLQIQRPVRKPQNEHPRRLISGFACSRSEVSGQRLWGLFQNRFGSPKAFFDNHIVMNYCPLAFLESSGRNRTPDKLPGTERTALIETCDRHLRTIIEVLEPQWLVGIGDFAAKCAARVFPNGQIRIGQILHPSPASPAANRDWAAQATEELVRLGIWKE